MHRYDPARMERSTRDIVSRASYMEITAGRGTAAGGVNLDVSHLGRERIEREFAGMLARCLDFGYDLRSGPVEVSPTAHFLMGGARIDVACHATRPGLLVAGEDAGGAHGANRLGGNGVAESTVFGAIAGETAVRDAHEVGLPELDAAHAAEIERQALAPLAVDATRREDPFSIRQQLEALMWERVGLVRDGSGLRSALDELAQLRARVDRVAAPSHRRLNMAWAEALDVRNLIEVAQLTTRAALERCESRGAHYRSDYPEIDDEHWLANVHMRGDDVWTEPARFTRVSPPSRARALAL
jgi:succinate dehydrogenase / fumarate reductase flavoprotein subunit/fumarate reductase flavoprotein subunit